MFLQLFNAFIGYVGVMFATVLGFDLGGINYGIIVGGLLIVSVIVLLLRGFVNASVRIESYHQANEFRKPGHFKIK